MSGIEIVYDSDGELCGRSDLHTHSQTDWRELIDNTPLPWEKR